jgi:hypothetical protein
MPSAPKTHSCRVFFPCVKGLFANSLFFWHSRNHFLPSVFLCAKCVFSTLGKLGIYGVLNKMRSTNSRSSIVNLYAYVRWSCGAPCRRQGLHTAGTCMRAYVRGGWAHPDLTRACLLPCLARASMGAASCSVKLAAVQRWRRPRLFLLDRSTGNNNRSIIADDGIRSVHARA